MTWASSVSSSVNFCNVNNNGNANNNNPRSVIETFKKLYGGEEWSIFIKREL